MKGYIYLPISVKKYITDRLHILFNSVGKQLNFPVEYTNDPKVPADADVVITYGAPYHAWPTAMMELTKLDKKTKLICVLADLWSHGNKVYENNMPKMLDRADLLLSACFTGFEKLWGNWTDKMEYFPNYFSPHDRYAKLPYNTNPIMKISLAGAVGDFYKLRTFIINNLDKTRVFRPGHPGYHPDMEKLKSNPNIFVNDSYAKMLNEYFCGLATSARYNFLTFKFTEISAAGSLVIADACDDVLRAGYKPNEHFIPITKEDALETIYNILDSPDKFEHIRLAGRRFTINNHSINNRINQIVNAVNRITGKR